jgi:transcriptional regulator with XRE-family HTH domain
MKDLRTLRKQHNLTLAQVAHTTGLSISFISDLECKRTAPSLKTLERLSECYGVPLPNLVGDDVIEGADSLYSVIGSKIRMEREELGFTQQELSNEIGLLRTSIANIEAGRQRLPIHVLYAIADALGVSVMCLLPNNLSGSVSLGELEGEL